MKKILLSALLSIASILSLQAEYTDSRGVKQMGSKPQDGKKSGLTGKFDEKKDASKTKVRDTTFEDIYGPDLKRTVNGEVLDLTEVIQWANEKEFLAKTGPKYTPAPLSEIGGSPRKTESLVPDWQKRNSECLKNNGKFSQYLVKGFVLEVLDDGVLISCSPGSVFLKNYPNQKTVVDKDKIDVIAVPVGRLQLPSSSGTGTRTVKEYDYGVPVK